MDIEDRLHQLEFHYRRAVSAAAEAKAHYFALAGEPSASIAALSATKDQWQQLESCKQDLAARMSELESLDERATP